MGGFGAAAGPAAAAGTRQPHGTPSGNAMGRSGRAARCGGAAGPRRGFRPCCFSRTQDGARSWRLLGAAAGINRSLPRVGGGEKGAIVPLPPHPAGEVRSAPRPSRDPPPAPAGGKGAAPTPAPLPGWYSPDPGTSLRAGGCVCCSHLVPPQHCGRSAPRYGGPLGSLGPCLAQLRSLRQPGLPISPPLPARRGLSPSVPAPLPPPPPPSASVVGAE